MALSPVAYAIEYPWLSAGNNFSNRPYSFISVHGPSGKVDLWALVDSGADYLQLEDTIAHSIGLGSTLASAPSATVTVSSGATVSMKLLSGVRVTIESTTVLVDVLFSPAPSDALLGRTGFLAAIDVGVHSSGWMFK